MEDKPEGTVLVLLDIYSKTIYTLQNFSVNNIGKQQGLGDVAGRQIVTLKQGILNRGGHLGANEPTVALKCCLFFWL